MNEDGPKAHENSIIAEEPLNLSDDLITNAQVARLEKVFPDFNGRQAKVLAEANQCYNDHDYEQAVNNYGELLSAGV